MFSCQVSHWSKFHVNIITTDWPETRNPEIENSLVWVLPNISRLGWVRDAKFDANVSHEMLLNAAKCQGYSFYRSWFIKGKPTSVVKLLLPPPPQTRLGLNALLLWWIWILNIAAVFSLSQLPFIYAGQNFQNYFHLVQIVSPFRVYNLKALLLTRPSIVSLNIVYMYYSS